MTSTFTPKVLRLLNDNMLERVDAREAQCDIKVKFAGLAQTVGQL